MELGFALGLVVGGAVVYVFYKKIRDKAEEAERAVRAGLDK